MTDPLPGPSLELVKKALNEGDLDEVSRAIAAGASVRYRDANGYDAMIHAVHGRDVGRDPRLLQLLKFLVDSGVELSGVTLYKESALRVLSRIGRFDAVKLLLDAGADRLHLGWTPLIEAVALGSPGEVEARIKAAAALEDVDWWERTAWLIALLVGDIAKAKLLLAAGANPDARGRSGVPALFYAIAGHHPDAVRWLLEIGQDVNGTDKFGTTPLMSAVDHDDLECVEILLAAGADIAPIAIQTAFARATTAAIARRLLAAGADPQELSFEGRRALLGYPPEPDARLMIASPEDFERACSRRFGTTNPERIDEPFWESMIRSGITGYQAMQLGGPGARNPIWCAQRFGQSLTFLPDGRIVQIAGEHEDAYDEDFCIYNDVFVHGADGSIAIYGYPESSFPPTDFHTATLIGDYIYVIGSVGYMGTRRLGETPLYRLDVNTFRMERLDASGNGPGWLSRHRAMLISPRQIQVSGGKVERLVGGKDTYADNAATFVLDVERLEWRQERPLRSV